MAEIIKLHKMRQEIDDEFIGFRPQNTSVKPVHMRAVLCAAYLASPMGQQKFFDSPMCKAKKGS